MDMKKTLSNILRGKYNITSQEGESLRRTRVSKRRTASLLATAVESSVNRGSWGEDPGGERGREEGLKA